MIIETCPICGNPLIDKIICTFLQNVVLIVGGVGKESQNQLSIYRLEKTDVLKYWNKNYD